MHLILLHVNLLVGLFMIFTHQETTLRNHNSECVDGLHILFCSKLGQMYHHFNTSNVSSFQHIYGHVPTAGH